MFDRHILSIELHNLLRKEEEMYEYYSKLLLGIYDNRIREILEFIKDQEENHVHIVKEIMSLLKEHISSV